VSKRYHQTILVSCEIPWDESQRLIERAFREEIRTAIALFNDVYIFGTAGEGYAVTNSLFKDIVSIFCEEAKQGGVRPMVCVIAMSTAQVTERIAIAREMGVRAFQIALPSWGALNDEECLTFFQDVCGEFPDSKFLHYNLPRTKRILLGPDYRRLEEAVPNLVGTKNLRDSITDIDSIATHTTELQHFWGENSFAWGCLYGECSLLSSWGGLFPKKTKEFFDHGVNGRIEDLFRMTVEYLQVTKAFEGPGLLQADRIDGAWDKMIVRGSGIDMPMRMLSPYQAYSIETFEDCMNAVRQNYPEWLATE
jgi:dihydrodipicolinate synthase/N-acetylneuraminate lyase